MLNPLHRIGLLLTLSFALGACATTSQYPTKVKSWQADALFQDIAERASKEGLIVNSDCGALEVQINGRTTLMYQVQGTQNVQMGVAISKNPMTSVKKLVGTETPPDNSRALIQKATNKGYAWLKAAAPTISKVQKPQVVAPIQCGFSMDFAGGFGSGPGGPPQPPPSHVQGQSGGFQSSGLPGVNRCSGFALESFSSQTPGMMSTQRFESMKRDVAAESFSSGKMDALKTQLELGPQGLTVKQVRDVISWFKFSKDKINALKEVQGRIRNMKAARLTALLKDYTFSNDRMKVLVELKDTILDLDNRYDVLAAFKFSSDKKKARKILATSKGRSYLWGTLEAGRVVFVVDVSGSMSASGRLPDGSRGSRLAFMKREMRNFLQNQMASNIEFDIIAFSAGVTAWKGQLVSGQQQNLDAASNFVSSLSAGGGTNINDALEHAFQYKGVEAVYLLTDGMPSVGKATSPASIRQNVLGWNQNIGLSLNTVALLSGGGSGKSGPRQFMYELALQNCGQFRSVE